MWGVLGAIANATDRLGVGTGVTCPTIADPSGDHRPGCCHGSGVDARAVLPRRGHGRAAQRARRRPALARVGGPRGDARGSRGRDPRTVDRRGDQPSRAALHGRERPHLHAARVRCRRSTSPAALRGWRRSPAGSATASSAPARSEEVVDAYRKAGGDGPRFGQVTVCWAEDEAAARRTALEWWPTAAIHGNELAGAGAAGGLRGARHRSSPRTRSPRRSRADPASGRSSMRSAAYVDAGYDHVYLHQVGPDQRGFLDFAAGGAAAGVRPRAGFGWSGCAMSLGPRWRRRRLLARR